MFHGSVPADMCRIVREHVSLWTDVTDVYNVCCGNFTVEKTIASLGKNLHSCDVLMYSTAIGRYYAGDPMPLVLTEQALAEFPWLPQTHNTPAEQLATMLLCTRLAPLMGKNENHVYWSKMRRAYEQQWPDLHAKTLAKVEAAQETLKAGRFDLDGLLLRWTGRLDVPPLHALPDEAPHAPHAVPLYEPSLADRIWAGRLAGVADFAQGGTQSAHGRALLLKDWTVARVSLRTAWPWPEVELAVT